MKNIKYKGYTGNVEFSEEDNCLFGEVQGLPKKLMITYEGETVEELVSNFHNAIDHYVSSCEERGIAPQKPYSGTINVRLSSPLHSKIAELAQEANLSLNAFIKKTLQQQVTI